jgi:hypothetical protein
MCDFRSWWRKSGAQAGGGQGAGAAQGSRLVAHLAGSGIGCIRARSPQAKGRIERLWRTLQDRLIVELRLRRIATRDAANAFLPLVGSRQD